MNRKNIFFWILLLVGISLIMYPLVGQYLSYRAEHDNINEYSKEISKLDSTDISNRITLAEAYNYSLYNNKANDISDPFTSKEILKGKETYANMLEVHEQLGYIIIPKIKQQIPIYAGTSDDVLQKGIGHLEGTSLPVGGKNTHTVLTGHRGLPTAELFTHLDKLEIGDKFYIRNIKEIIAYQVDKVSVVEPSDVSQLKIINNEDYATLLTCTPYMINSHRLLVRGHRVPYTKKDNKAIREQKNNKYNLFLIIILVMVIVVVFKKLILRENYGKSRK